jgi:hypothetical protein
MRMIWLKTMLFLYASIQSANGTAKERRGVAIRAGKVAATSPGTDLTRENAFSATSPREVKNEGARIK